MSVAAKKPRTDSVRVVDTAWYKRMKRTSTPAIALKNYREMREFTQEQLAGKLGPTVSKQHVSNMENGRRGISIVMAKKLAKIFGTSPDRFI